MIVHNPESRRESAVEVFYMYSTMCHVVSSCPTAPFCTFMNGRLTSRLRPNAEGLKWAVLETSREVSLYIQFTNWWDSGILRPFQTPSAGDS